MRITLLSSSQATDRVNKPLSPCSNNTQKKLLLPTTNPLTLARECSSIVLIAEPANDEPTSLSWTRRNPNSANPNPRRIMKRIGFLCEFLNRPMHGGDSSTCPLRFLIRSGSIHIVNLHFRVNTNFCQ